MRRSVTPIMVSGPMVEGGSLKIYAAMMRSMDAGIGRVLDALRRAGAERNTLVIFTSDNGGERYSFNWPFSFQKGFLVGGRHPCSGHRALAGCRPRGTHDRPGRDHDGLDGDDPLRRRCDSRSRDIRSMARTCSPYAAVRRSAYDRTLFWRAQIRDAARSGRWKYPERSEWGAFVRPCDDPGEKVDLRLKNADVFAQLKAQYDAWNARMLPKPTV